MKSSLIAGAFFISMLAVASCAPGDEVSESPLPAVSAEELLVDGPRYEDETSLVFPTDYREWPFIGSGLGLTYDEEAREADSETAAADIHQRLRQSVLLSRVPRNGAMAERIRLRPGIPTI